MTLARNLGAKSDVYNCLVVVVVVVVVVRMCQRQSVSKMVRK